MATTFAVVIDWDGDGTWSYDETSRVRRVEIGKGLVGGVELVAAVGRCVLVVDNADRRFSPGNAGGALYGLLVPRREVRITATSGSTWTLFRGFVERIVPGAGDAGGGECVIECVDGMAILDRQLVSVEHEDSKAVDEAVSDVVALAYSPPASDYRDNGDSLDHFGRAWNPEETTALRALREICAAVYGRFYLARDGTATFLPRDEVLDSSGAAAWEVYPGDYWSRLLGTQADDLLAAWRFDEMEGAEVGDDSGNGYDGDVYGITWAAYVGPDGGDAPSFDGVNDYVDVYDAGLVGGLDWDELSVIFWVRVSGAGVWADTTVDFLLDWRVGGNDYVWVRKTGTGTILATYKAGGVAVDVESGVLSGTGWVCVGLRVSVAEDSVKLFIDGVEVDEGSGLGVWSGTPGRFYVGKVYPGSYFWNGGVALVGLWGVALLDSEFAALGAV